MSRHVHVSSKGGWLAEALHSTEGLLIQGMPMSRDLAYHLVDQCEKQKNLELGRRVNSLMACSGFDSAGVFADHLIRFFASCGSLAEANQSFSKVATPSHYTWNAILSAHAKFGESTLALHLYDQMQHQGIKPDRFTFLSILKACTITGSMELGRQFHQEAIENGLQSNIFVGNTLVDTYAKCGNLEEAFRVFNRLPSRDVVTWGAMIAGYVQQGKGFLALECFENMHYEGVKPDKVAFLSTLKACGSINAMERGRCIHDQIIHNGLDSDIVLGSTLVDMYAKCGDLGKAFFIFDKLLSRNVVTWGAMISGYAQHGEGFLALKCYENMQHDGILPDKVAFLSILKACSSIGAIKQGKHIHKQIIESGLQSDIVVGSTLVDMYAKCGDIEEARRVFDELPNHNVVSWNAMLGGYAQSGHVTLVGYYLKEMQQEGIEPNDVTFATILAGCSHAARLDEALKYLQSMREDYDIIPDARHYTCMVDLLGRTGRLVEASNLLENFEADVLGWRCLLAACRTYGNVEIGRHCFDQVLKSDLHGAGAYVLMSSIYSDAGMWMYAVEIEELRQRAGAWKKPAKAWIEVNDKVHEFIVGEKTHPENDAILHMLKQLSNRMRDAGYVPKIDLVMQNMSIADKEDALCGHCEKFAIAYGILCTPPGTTIRATKNLRVCMDCHNATKIISKIEQREIIIKDAYHLHHFHAGFCSCEDQNAW